MNKTNYYQIVNKHNGKFLCLEGRNYDEVEEKDILVANALFVTNEDERNTHLLRYFEQRYNGSTTKTFDDFILRPC